MKQVQCIPSSKLVFHILHPSRTQKKIFHIFSTSFSLLPMQFQEADMRMFYKILKHVFDNPFHGIDLYGNRPPSRSKKVYYHLFLDLEKLWKKMPLDIFKLLPSRLMDAHSPYFHPIEKHYCHQSVEKIFLEDPSLNISSIAYALKCIICSFSCI